MVMWGSFHWLVLAVDHMGVCTRCKSLIAASRQAALSVQHLRFTICDSDCGGVTLGMTKPFLGGVAVRHHTEVVN